MKPDFEAIRTSDEIRTYITQADASLMALGYTEHSFAHVTRCAQMAAHLLSQLGYDQRQVELARIAGYMHDIGNVVNRVDHAQSGAVMAFRILDKMGMAPEDVAVVITAIGNHDEGTAYPVNAVAAALILADKTDVRRSRVRNRATISFDIHDRVNYAVEQSDLTLDTQARDPHPGADHRHGHLLRHGLLRDLHEPDAPVPEGGEILRPGVPHGGQRIGGAVIWCCCPISAWRWGTAPGSCGARPPKPWAFPPRSCWRRPWPASPSTRGKSRTYTWCAR